MTVNNFIVKEVGTDFGVIMAIRGLLQPVVMFTIMAFEGLKFSVRKPLHFTNFLNCLGNIKKIFPSTWYYQFLVILVGILGAMEILATFACVMYMPVS